MNPEWPHQMEDLFKQNPELYRMAQGIQLGENSRLAQMEMPHDFTEEQGILGQSLLLICAFLHGLEMDAQSRKIFSTKLNFTLELHKEELEERFYDWIKGTFHVGQSAAEEVFKDTNTCLRRSMSDTLGLGQGLNN